MNLLYSQKSPVFGQFLFNAIVFSVEGQANRELKEPSSRKLIRPDIFNPNFTIPKVPEVIKNQTGNGFRIWEQVISLLFDHFSNF